MSTHFKKLIFFTTILFISGSGCSKSESSAPLTPTKPAAAPPLPTTASTPAANVEGEKPLLMSFLNLHEKAYGKDVTAKFNEFNKKFSMRNFRLNESIKAEIESALGFSEIIYDSNARTLGSVFDEGAIQCYSGTSLFAAVLEKNLSDEEIEARRFVVISTQAHGVPQVMPGYIAQDGEKFRLIGIDMTLNGEGLQDFGYTTDISVPVRVVSLGDWLRIEVGSAEKTLSSRRAFRLMVQFQSDYGIPVRGSGLPSAVDASAITTVSANPLVFGDKPLVAIRRKRE